MKISSCAAPLKCNFAFRSKCESPTASARNEAKGPPTGTEKSSGTSDPGSSITTKLAPMRSIFRLTSRLWLLRVHSVSAGARLAVFSK
jgi:hypothetical protein